MGETELVCEECGGTGTISDPYDYYDVDIPDRCRACRGTGVRLQSGKQDRGKEDADSE